MFALTHLTYSLLATVAKFLIIFLFLTLLFDLVVNKKRRAHIEIELSNTHGFLY